VRNAAKAVCNARIQVIIDLKSGRFVHFTIDPYSRNDVKAAFDLVVKAGDLVLRDRGYLAIAAVVAIIQAGADFISRYKHSMTLINPTTGKPLNLLWMLRRYGQLDMQVGLGRDGVPIRLVAQRVSPQIASLRRLKLKRDTNGHKPSGDLLALCDWSIYLTSLPADEFSYREIMELYGLRWRIECIFKAWKSNFNFAKLHQVSALQLRILITARLLLITLLTHDILIPLGAKLAAARLRPLSLLKFTRYISLNFHQLSPIIQSNTVDTDAIRSLIHYCSYDKRRRLTYEDDLALAFRTLEIAA